MVNASSRTGFGLPVSSKPEPTNATPIAFKADLRFGSVIECRRQREQSVLEDHIA